MCVIMSSTPGVPAPPVEHLENANDHNPHGWGVAVNLPALCAKHRPHGKRVVSCHDCRQLSEVVVERGFNTDDLIQSVRNAELLREQNRMASLVIHARIATGGGVNLNNTHPFAVNDKIVLFHNGIFPEKLVPITNPKKPDSWHVAQMVKPVLDVDPARFLAKDFRAWMDALCQESHSKVVLLDAIAGPVLYNVPLWVDGLEGRNYSNSTPMEEPWSYTYFQTKAPKDDFDDEGYMHWWESTHNQKVTKHGWEYADHDLPPVCEPRLKEVPPWEPIPQQGTPVSQLREDIQRMRDAGATGDDIVAMIAARRLSTS